MGLYVAPEVVHLFDLDEHGTAIAHGGGLNAKDVASSGAQGEDAVASVSDAKGEDAVASVSDAKESDEDAVASVSDAKDQG